MTNDEVNKRIAELRGDGPEWAPGRLSVDVLPHPQYTDDWGACGVLLEESYRGYHMPAYIEYRAHRDEYETSWWDVAGERACFVIRPKLTEIVARIWLGWNAPYLNPLLNDCPDEEGE